MGITYVGGQVGGRAGSTSTTNITFALSGGSDTTPQAGDLVVIGCAVGSQGRTPACAISGYTSGTQQNANGTTYDTSLNKSYKFMGLTPDTTFTLPSTGNIADAQRYTVQVWRGVDPANPFDVADVVATGTATGRPNPGSITPTTSGAVVGIIGAGAAGTGAAYTAPANYTTNFLTGTTADTNDAMIGSGYRSWTSGAEDPAAYTGGTTNAADSWAAFTYALRPEVSYEPTLISTEVVTLGQVASPGAQNLTVPSDAQAVVVHFSCYAAAAAALSLSSNFAGTFTIVQDAGIDEQGGVAFAVVSSTGAKTITPTWGSAPSEGPLFFVSYIKGVDTAASFVRSIKNQVREDTGTTAATVDLASRNTDLVIALDKNFNTSETAPGNPSGWTSVATQGNVDEGGRLRTLDAPNDGKNTITGQTNTYSAIMAIALRGVEASGDLAGAASGAAQAAGSATLSGQIALAAVGVSTAGGSGNAGVSVPLSAAGLAVAGGSANRVATVTVAAAGLAQAAGSAGLAVGVQVAAAGAAAATGNAALVSQIALAASGAASAAGNALLAAQLAAIASGAAEAAGTANLTGGVGSALSASGGATASGSASLVAHLAAVAAGLASASGAAAAGVQVAASATGGAVTSGNATLKAQLEAVAAGGAVAGGSAALVTLFAAAATGTAQASGTASLTGGAAGSVSATGAAQAAGTAMLTISIGLAAADGSQASGTAQLNTAVGLSAAGYVEAIGAGQLVVDVQIAAAGQAGASGSATFTLGQITVRAPAGNGPRLRPPTGDRPHDQSSQRAAALGGHRLASSNTTRPSATGGRRPLH